MNYYWLRWFEWGFGVVGNVIFGVICGLFPLVYGLAKGQPRRGLLAIATCIVASFFCGILLAPLVAVFYVWRIAKSREDEVDEDEEGTGLMSLNLSSKSIDEGVETKTKEPGA